MNLYIADLHFGHNDIIAFDRRPFKDTRDMDSTIIARWNEKVRDDDDVWIIGDICYQNAQSEESYLRRLKGRKHLIIGNHDDKIISDPDLLKYFVDEPKQIRVISDTLEGKRHMICLCHYPMAEWEGKFRGYFHIFGHIHALHNDAYYYMRDKDHALNAGAMINDYTPVSFEELIENNRKYKAQ